MRRRRRKPAHARSQSWHRGLDLTRPPGWGRAAGLTLALGLIPALALVLAIGLLGRGPARAGDSAAGPGRSSGSATGGAGSRSGLAGSSGATARTAGTTSAREPAGGTGRPRATAPGRPGGAGAQPSGPADPAGPAAAQTSCRSVAHIGDSTSVDLISPADLPDPAQRLAARYRAVGVRQLRIDASGGRSIVEELPGQVNGYDVASAWWREGYRGCWVFALGTNDTANIAVGSPVGMMTRIERMMSAAHGEPVLWVNTRTLLTSGPWSEANEQAWDRALVAALPRYPNMRIFDWAAVARPGWFLPDGVHYNQAGCEHRAQAIAQALARAFPLGGHSQGSIVG